ncbi:hypothetical protein pah_c028o034 [Parachlamydia acanthamoebae str. Hall's coccus]|nr:hypothetical protein pah_c028o034 [Parachlamydia acanthamoebae str. Hall's coccus]
MLSLACLIVKNVCGKFIITREWAEISQENEGDVIQFYSRPSQDS